MGLPDGYIAGSATNKSKYGIQNEASNVQFGSGVATAGNFGTGGFSQDATKGFGGFAPTRPAGVSVSWPSAAPSTGVYANGSICFNTNPSATSGSKIVSHWIYMSSAWHAVTIA